MASEWTREALFVIFCVCALSATVAVQATERVAQWGIRVAPGSPCVDDSDCADARAVCYYSAFGPGRVCGCAFGSWWRAEEAACLDTTAWVTLNASLGVVHIDQRVRLVGRGLDTPAPELVWAETHSNPLRNTALPAIPYAWRCHAGSRTCAARTDGVDIITTHPDDWVLVRHRSLGVRQLPAARVAYRCTAGDGRRQRRLLDNQALASVGNAGMRALSDHCGGCDAAWCNYRGSCAGDFECTCDTGWSGAQCETPTPTLCAQTEQTARALLALRACTADAECGVGPGYTCASGAAFSGTTLTRLCICSIGYVPAPVSGSLICVAAMTPTVIVGVRVDGSYTVDIAFSASRPEWVWWLADNGATRHVAFVANPYTERAVARWDPVWVFRGFGCASDLFFWDSTRSTDPVAHCLGAVHVCGAGVDTVQSNPLTGACVCLPNFLWSSNRCDGCSAAWAGPTCALNASSCAFDVCSGRGVCAGGLLATRAARPVARAEIYDAPGCTVLPLYGVVDDPGYDANGLLVIDTRNTTHTVVLVSPAQDDIYYVDPATNTPAWVSFGRGDLAHANDSVPACQCAPGVGGDRCDREPEACARDACGRVATEDDQVRGQCVRTAWGTECEGHREAGRLVWFGALANQSRSECRALRCSGRGECLHQQQGCTCDATFEGRDCSVRVCGAAGRVSPTNSTSCICDTGVEGETCDLWPCHRDSLRDPITGACACAGLWTFSALTAACTEHPCGWGEPRPGLPSQCMCRNANATRHATAPFCRQLCAHAVGFTSRGACVCAPHWTGTWCDIEVARAEVPPGDEPWYPAGESLRDPSLTLGVVTIVVSLIGSLFVLSYDSISSRVRARE